MKTFLAIVAGALLGALAIATLNGHEPLEERVVRLETEEALPGLADELAGWPAPVQRVFLDYAGDEELVLNARLALMKHPTLAPRVLTTFGHTSAFRHVLRDHGPAVVPPIHFFMRHEITTVWLSERIGDWLAGTGDATGDGMLQAGAAEPVAGWREPVPPVRRGWYAMQFIDDEGHDFLGQFVTDDAGRVHWIQTERVATGTKRFLTSGLATLETKHRLDQERTAADYGWAAVDVLAPIATLKVLRAGKGAAAAGRTARAARVTRAGSFAARSARVGKYAVAAGAVAGTAYVVTHPSVIGSIGAEVSDWLGYPRWLGSVGLWFLVLLPVLLLARLAWRWLGRPLYRLVALAIAALAALQERLPGHAREQRLRRVLPPV